MVHFLDIHSVIDNQLNWLTINTKFELKFLESNIKHLQMAIFCDQLGSFLISAIFCTYQLYIVCVQYLQYDVSTMTTLTYPTNNTPPSITICTESHLQLLEPFKSNLTPSLIDKLTNYSFHEEIWFFTERNFVRLSDKMENFTASKLIKRYHICYEYAFNSSVKVNYARTDRVLYIKLSSVTFGKLMMVHIHSHDTDISGSFDSMEFPGIVIHKSRDYSFIYDHYDLHFQPYPYVTDCMDYKWFKCGSQSKCLDECINNYLLRYYNQLNDNYVFRKFSNDTISYSDSLVETDYHQVALGKCAPYFRQRPCHFHLHTHYSIPTSRPLGHGAIIYGPGYAPCTMVDYMPTMVLTDFVIYALSTVGFWLGVAPPTLLYSVQTYIASKITNDRINQSDRNQLNTARFISYQIKINRELNTKLDRISRSHVNPTLK